MNPKRLICTPEEARRLHNGETVEIVRKMKPQPVEKVFMELYGLNGYRFPLAREFWHLDVIKHDAPADSHPEWQELIRKEFMDRFCPFPIGSRWWVAERAKYFYSSAGVLVPGSVSCYSACDCENGGALSAARMPRWASRTIAESTACRVELRDGVWYWVADMKGSKA